MINPDDIPLLEGRMDDRTRRMNNCQRKQETVHALDLLGENV